MVYVYSNYPIEEEENYYPIQHHPIRQPSKQKLKRRPSKRQPIENVVWVEEEQRYHDPFPYYEPFIDDDIEEYPYEMFYPPPPPFIPPTHSLPLPPPHPSWYYEDQPIMDYYINEEDNYYYENENIQHEIDMLEQEKEYLKRMNNNKKRFSRVVHKNIINEPMIPMPYMPPPSSQSTSFVTQPPSLLRHRRSQPILKKKNHPIYHQNNDDNDIYYSYDNDIILNHHHHRHTSPPSYQRKRSSSYSHSFPSHVNNHSTHHHHNHLPLPSILNENRNPIYHQPSLPPPSTSIDQHQLLSSNSSTSMLHQPSDIQIKHNNSFFGQSVNNNNNNHLIPIPQPMIPSNHFFPIPPPPPPPPPPPSSIHFPTLPGLIPPLQQQQQHLSPMILPKQQISSLPTSPNLSTLSLSSPTLINKNNSLLSSHPNKKKKEEEKKEKKEENKTPKEDLDISSPHSIASDSKIKKKENQFIPLGRSLSLGTSQSLLKEKEKSIKRRGSFFGSMFSSSTSVSSNKKEETFVPVHELNNHSLTRKQSIQLEKKIKELSKREFIWCYQINQQTSTYFLYNQGKRIQSEGGNRWFAMTSKNQLKLDPYIMLYQSIENINVEGLRRPELLSKLIHLEKEPKLTGSITAMPHSKMARVYPSMFNANNYIEIFLNCLPIDSQFVIQQ